MYQKEFQWLYDKSFTNIYDLLIVLKQQSSSWQQWRPKQRVMTMHDDDIKEIVRFLLENGSFLQRRVTAKLQCEIWWLTATLTLVPFLFEAAQIPCDHPSWTCLQGHGARVRVSQHNRDKRLPIMKTAENGWRTQTEGSRVQWSLKVLLSVQWHLRAWPTGTTCHSPTCFYPYKSNRGPGSRWQITAATSWQQPEDQKSL